MTIKCHYYNVGYCKNKEECTLLHPTLDCEEECFSSKCLKRHRRKCANGNNDCYYYSMNKCEFKHDTNEAITTNIIQINYSEVNKVLQSRINELENIEHEDNNVMIELNNRIDELNNIINVKDASIIKMSESYKDCIDKINNLEKMINNQSQ